MIATEQNASSGVSGRQSTAGTRLPHLVAYKTDGSPLLGRRCATWSLNPCRPGPPAEHFISGGDKCHRAVSRPLYTRHFPQVMAPPKQTAAERQRARLMAAATWRAEPDAAPAGKTAVRSKPVRITVDLPPETCRQLREWTTKAAAELDLPRLALADARRAMVRVAAVDNGTSGVVADMIRREKEA
jgi:hypothetical protein